MVVATGQSRGGKKEKKLRLNKCSRRRRKDRLAFSPADAQNAGVHYSGISAWDVARAAAMEKKNKTVKQAGCAIAVFRIENKSAADELGIETT